MSNKVAKGFRSPKVSFLGKFGSKFGSNKVEPTRSIPLSSARSILNVVSALGGEKSADWAAGCMEMEKLEIEEAESDLQESLEAGDREGIADAYSRMFGSYSAIKHPDTVEMGNKSVAAAIDAYGAGSLQHAEELSMFAVHYEFNGQSALARQARDESVNIFEKTAGVNRFIEALESVFTSYSPEYDGDALEAFARRGIAFVKAHSKPGTKDYRQNMEYLNDMLETAHDIPIPMEERIRNTAKLFPLFGNI